MPRGGDEFLQQHRRVAESRLRLAAGARQRGGKLLGARDKPHPLAATARDGLDQQRPADRLGLLRQPRVVLIGAVIAGDDRHARRGHQRLGAVLQAHGADRVGCRADEDQPRGLHRLGEIGVFRQEAIAGVDRVGAGGAGGRKDGVAAKIAFGGGRRADAHRRIGQMHMQRIGIGIGMHRDRPDPHAPRGADDAARDLAPVGDQKARNPRHHMRNTPQRVGRAGALLQAASDRLTTRRVSRGSITPSSQSLAEA